MLPTESLEVKNIFQKLHFVKSVSFEVFWISFGAFIFFSFEGLINLYNEPHFLFAQIVFGGTIALAPIIYNFYHIQFKNVVKNLNVLFNLKNEEWEQMVTMEERIIFTLKRRESRFIISLMVFFTIYTLIYLPMPFKTPLLTILYWTNLLILAFFGSFIIQFSIMLLLFLRKLTSYDIFVRFYLFPHPALTKLLRYFSGLSILSSLGYIALVFAVWFGPYGFNTQMLLWLAALAFYPIMIFMWSYFHIHIIQHNIKFSFIDLINQQVNDSLLMTLQDKDSNNIEKLDKFMVIQSKLHALKEYPFEVGGLLTFLLTTIITIIQIIFAIQKH